MHTWGRHTIICNTNTIYIHTYAYTNRDVYCSDPTTNYFYLFISAISEFTDIMACNHSVYTCQAIGSFTVNVTGMHALPVLSYSKYSKCEKDHDSCVLRRWPCCPQLWETHSS